MLVYTRMSWRARPPSSAWLSVTPEPERLLPDAVATLLAGGPPAPDAIARERDQLDRLIRRARLRPWLAYLARALALADQRGAASDAAVARARELTVDLIANHHNLMLGLGRGAGRPTASQRLALARHRLSR